MGGWPAVVAVLARRRGNPQATIGGALFVFGGLVTSLGVFIPQARSAQTATGALALLSLACIAIGVVLLLLPRRWADRVPEIAVLGALAIVTWGLAINGERAGGPPVFSELFYLWPILYVGYYLRPWKTYVTVVLVAVSYLLTLISFPGPMSDMGARYVIVMASFVGLAVAMRLLRVTVDRLLHQLKAAARTDSLTGLLNRRAFDEQLQAETSRSNRTGEPFALLLGDVDHFKQINDRYGHAAGDDALQRVADLLQHTARQVDTVARIGGEEFALILPGTDREGGVEAAERIRQVLRVNAGIATLTMSFGVVEGPQDGRVAENLLRAADRALYAAKAKGRDRTETALGGSALTA
jgi:diguanylate cyclase (GGDEF)-like protein